MSDRAFDDLTRAIGRCASRREVLRLLFSAVGTGVLASLAGACDGGDPTGTDGSGQETTRRDAPTFESIEAALEELANGSNEAALTPDGSAVYRRTLVGGQVTSEEIVVDGVPTVVAEHTASESTRRVDGDGDGFFERRVEADDHRLVVMDYLPETQQVLERRTHTRLTDQVVEVELEIPDEDGSLVTVARYEVGPTVEALSRTNREPRASNVTPCTPAECAGLHGQFVEAVNQGLLCLHDRGGSALEWELTLAIAQHTVEVVCENLPDKECDDGSKRPRRAQTDPPWWLIQRAGALVFPNEAIRRNEREIRVNSQLFCDLTAQEQLSTLFHEALHLIPGLFGHHEDKERATNPEEVDRVYACEAFCFDSAATRCSCARCLGTTPCEANCAGGAPCTGDFGAWCLCDSRFKWHPDCTDCASECRTGLQCFNAGCLRDSGFLGGCTPIPRRCF